jgi:hypothetical protein
VQAVRRGLRLIRAIVVGALIGAAICLRIFLTSLAREQAAGSKYVAIGIIGAIGGAVLGLCWVLIDDMLHPR